MKALLVEDNPGDVRFLQEILVKTPRQDITLEVATTLTEATRFLSHHPVDIILLDLSLPDSQGLDTLISLGERFPTIPIIVLTGVDDDHLGTNVMRHGAQDYLVKGHVDEHWIRRTMHYAVERKRLEQRLRTALSEAEAANNSKTNFLASISHELRTPLNAILGFAEVIEQQIFGPLPTHYGEYAKNIHDSGTYLLSLINDLLDLAKATVGKLELDESNVNIHQLGMEVVQMLHVQAQQKQIYIRTRLSTEATYLWADERMLKQIMVNLLSNALKFTPKLGHITIGTFVDPVQQSLGFYVQDTGIGIAAKDQQRIFEPFIQLENPHKQATPGTGLGLPLVKRMTEIHGGQVKITSTPNEGTTLHIHFPWWRGQQNFAGKLSPAA